MSKQVRSALHNARKYAGVVALSTAAVAPMIYQVLLIAHTR